MGWGLKLIVEKNDFLKFINMWKLNNVFLKIFNVFKKKLIKK